MLCTFIESDGLCICLQCGRQVKTTECNRLVAGCRKAGYVPGENDPITCIHRGDASRPVKVECCGGKNKMLDSYRCNAPNIPQRLCILAGTIADEHERGLIAVCSPTCPGRSPIEAAHA